MDRDRILNMLKQEAVALKKDLASDTLTQTIDEVVDKHFRRIEHVVLDALDADATARKVLANMTGMSPDVPLSALHQAVIFGTNRHS